MGRVLRVLGVLLGLAVVVALTRQAAERAVRGHAPQHAPDQAAEPPPEVALEPTLQEVLAEATLEEERVEERQDADGHWALRHATWRLPQGQSPSVVAERLAARLKRLEGSPEVYVTAEDELDVQVRVYVGKRATLQLRLRPTLGAPARPAKRPEVALVLLGLGDLGPRARALLAEPIPFTVTVQPFSPFALRHSWDATRLDVELGVELSPADASPEAADEVLEAVFHPSAVTLVGAPASLPLDALYDRGMYIFDPAHELSPSLRRQAELAGVPVLRPDLVIGDSLAEDTLRLQHLAAERGSAIVAVDAGRPAAAELLRWLSRSSGLRPVYLGELAPPLPVR